MPRKSRASKDQSLGVMPANNLPRVFQAIFSIIAVATFLGTYRLVTCFSIFIFIAPQFIDLASLQLRQRPFLSVIRWIVAVFYFFCMVFCLLEWQRVLTDIGEAFKIADTAICWAGENFSKKPVVLSLLIHPIMYVLLFFGIPTKFTQGVEERAEKESAA